MVVNCAISVYLFLEKGVTAESRGYALGTALSVVYIVSLMVQARKILQTNSMALLKVFFLGFAIKFVALCGAMFAIWKTAPFFSISYFVASFLWVLFVATILEIVFYYATLKLPKQN